MTRQRSHKIKIDWPKRKSDKTDSYTFSCPEAFCLSPGNYYDTHAGKKLIESVYSKNNNYLLMTRAYEKDHGFSTTIPPKKNCKPPWNYDEHIYK